MELQLQAHKRCVQHPGACHATSWSASAEMREGASMGRTASGSVIGSVDASMWDAGVGVTTQGCDYDRRVRACVSSRGRRAGARKSVLAQDTGACTSQLGRGAGTHGCGMARGTGARECEHGHEHDMERPRGGPCMTWQRPCQGRGTGSQSRHGCASTDGSGPENSKSYMMHNDGARQGFGWA
ncbi:hypothetical protein SLEP1_g58044 [Rubroshorea leprosula]|uniref:Uncharacterized protein n=1 Tax=Rubroshorea leprosula TaxID=152421 RepID=A0AAV5MNF8_9ROSI|nr:hypothetical protein SLEP1_g58044 [Rubroshorea leprosula]